MKEQVPEELIVAIREGRCVAFVGAGFVQPTLPSWQKLLGGLNESVDDATQRREIATWLRRAKSNRDYEGLAELIKSALGPRFVPTLAQLLERPPTPATKRRLAFLHEVPFRAVLTTNFDPLIPGELPGPDAYARVLTAPRHAWWNQSYWSSSGREPPACIQLHGRVWSDDDAHAGSKIVFSTRDYRRLLYQEPGYRAFLRAVFATHTILYMGFSFTDAYVNELRSEVLAMLGLGRHGRAHDFAILNDVPPLVARHLTDNEGLVVLGYSTAVRGSDKRDFAGFDRWLDAIIARAGPERTLVELVAGKRILWLDPKPENNTHGFAVLRSAAELTKVDSPSAALERLRVGNRGARRRRGKQRYDLVISHFGYNGEDPSNCEQLLVGMRSEDLRAPVLVFAEPSYRERKRGIVLELGGYAYTDSWEELFQRLEELLRDAGSRHGRS